MVDSLDGSLPGHGLSSSRKRASEDATDSVALSVRGNPTKSRRRRRCYPGGGRDLDPAVEHDPATTSPTPWSARLSPAPAKSSMIARAASTRRENFGKPRLEIKRPESQSVIVFFPSCRHSPRRRLGWPQLFGSGLRESERDQISWRTEVANARHRRTRVDVPASTNVSGPSSVGTAGRAGDPCPCLSL